MKTSIKVNGEEALCIMLRRLAYPNRYAIYFLSLRIVMNTKYIYIGTPISWNFFREVAALSVKFSIT